MYAANEGYLELVKWLISNGANVNMRNNYRENALKCAMSNKYYDIAKIIKTFSSEMDGNNDNDNIEEEEEQKRVKIKTFSRKEPVKRIKRT